MPIYDPDRECPKCKNQEVVVLYIPHVLDRKEGFEGGLVDEEHMRRTCLRCSFQWAEKPAEEEVADEPG